MSALREACSGLQESLVRCERREVRELRRYR